MSTVGEGMWKQVKEKVDKVAEAVALMEVGQFEFADGKPKFTTEDGMQVPRVVKKEAMEYGGYKMPSQNAFTHIFSEKGEWRPYFLERLRWHRQRLSGGYRKALAELTDGGTALTEMSAKLWESLMYDLSDPDKAGKISFRDRAALYRDVTKLNAALIGEADSRRGPPRVSGPSVLNVINLPAAVAQKAQENLEVIEGELATDDL